MEYKIESYLEFIDDIRKSWIDVISENDFTLKKNNDYEVVMFNEKVKVSFLLDVDTRMGYIIENRQTNFKYNELSLHLFKNLPMVYDSFDNDNFKITRSDWFDLLAEENFRAICLQDIPIVKDEIMLKWPELIAGDFGLEKTYSEWLKWSMSESNRGKSFDELTYKSYQKKN